MLKRGDPDGFGAYGILDETEDGLLCHRCGQRFGHLGLHVYQVHGDRAKSYKQAHGLLRTRGLVSSELREKMRENAAARYDPAGALASSRNPAIATQARLAQGLSASAEEAAGRDERLARVGRAERIERVISCGFCGVQFCPLTNQLRRKYCSRRCAGRATRAAEAARDH